MNYSKTKTLIRTHIKTRIRNPMTSALKVSVQKSQIIKILVTMWKASPEAAVVVFHKPTKSSMFSKSQVRSKSSRTQSSSLKYWMSILQRPRAGCRFWTPQETLLRCTWHSRERARQSKIANTALCWRWTWLGWMGLISMWHMFRLGCQPTIR